MLYFFITNHKDKMAKQNIGTGLWQTIRGAINSNFDELYEYRSGSINVLEMGVRNDGTDQTSAIGVLIANNTQLFFPKGDYLINNLVVSNKKGLSLIGEKGTRFFTTNNYVFTFHSSIEELEITGIKFESTLVSNIEDTGGLLMFYTDTSSGIFEDVEIHHCYFTNEKTKCNAVKLISEGTNSMARNFKIHHNVFEKIGRMAIEVQNHVSDSVYRYMDIHSYNNYLRDIGTVHAATSVCGISYSGLGYNCSVDSNQIIDIHTVDSWAVVNYGIENAGSDNMSIQNNQILSLNYGFTAILTSSTRPKTGCIIANNTINVRLIGSTDPLKIRGMELFRLTKSKISNNSIFSHNYSIRVVASNKLMVTLNDCYSKAGNAIFVAEESSTGTTGCKFYFNNLDCSEAVEDNAPLLFSGSNTAHNFHFGNNCIKTGGAAGSIVSVSGASDNTKAYLAATTAEFVSEGFQESIRMVGNDGQIGFPDFGRSLKSSKNGILAGMTLDATVLDVTHQLAVGGSAAISEGLSSRKLNVHGLSVYADNAAAKAGGLQNGDLYRTGDIVKVVHA